MSEHWERSLLEKLASAALVEQRRSRRWKIFFRLVWLILIIFIAGRLWMSSNDDGRSIGIWESDRHTAVIALEGTIDNQNNTADKLRRALKAAYDDKGTKGIIISANSPGGSPVLSSMAYDEIRRKKKLHKTIPIYVVVSEVCASGCYYIASAADKIFVNQASIIGSIGVISGGFGFTGAMEKLGIERRLKTSGANKAMGDPFSPDNPKHDAIFQELLDNIHTQFIQAVKIGRGKRLRSNPDLFSGRVWLGDKSIPLGLADGLGTVQSVATDIIKAEKIVDYTEQDDLSYRLARQIGVNFISGILNVLQNKLF